MKHEWKKHEKDLYGAKVKPRFITVPRQNFIMLKGAGNPNNKDFFERVGVLFSLAYAIKFNFKARRGLGGYDDYSVYPLEGLWTSSNKDNPLDKDSFEYTVMIRQPDFITREIFEEARAATAEKKPHPLLNEIVFDAVEDGGSVQILHKGLFDDEPASFAKMDAFAKESGLERLNDLHREIYLNDANRTAPENRLTILRYQVTLLPSV